MYTQSKSSLHYQGITQYFKNLDALHTTEEEVFNHLSYIDCLNFASNFHASLLMGTGLLDVKTPSFSQYAVFNNVQANKKHCVYDKHEHELINFHENEKMEFLRWSN